MSQGSSIESQTDSGRVLPPELGAPARPAVNLRSLGVGLLGVVLISAITPYNDYVLNNTPLIGGSLPLAAVLFVFLFALLVNGPLSRFAPRRAFGSGELTVILVMLLVACVMPASGLMQYWPATVVGPWKHMGARPDQFEDMLRRMNLPDWFWVEFPAESRSVASRAGDPIVQDFYGRISDDVPFWSTFGEYLRRWLPPALGWGVFIVGMFGALVGMSFVVRRQWVENERIPFPIAQVELALIEGPRPRSFFNSTFSSRPFWIGLAIILGVRLLQGLSEYFPKHVPKLELSYNLYGVLSEPPWVYLQHIQFQTLYPLVVALMFFAASRIALSLWLTMLLWQIPCMWLGQIGEPLPRGFEYDSNTGSILAVFLMILWTGRHHFAHVLRRMFGFGRGEAPADPFLGQGVAGWMVVGGWLLASLWLWQVGMSVVGGMLLAMFLLITWVVMAYAVAHSGFPVAITRSGSRSWFGEMFRHTDPVNNYQPQIVAGQFHAQAIGGMWAYARDQLLVFGTHGLKVATERAPRAGRRLLGAIVLSLVLAFAVSHVSNLFCYYKYAAAQDKKADSPLNSEVLNGQPFWTVNHVLDNVHSRAARGGRQSLGDFQWIGASLGVTGLFAFLQLRYSWWPLHPIGLLMLFAFAIRRLWLSVLVGWLIKVLIVRFGGAGLYLKARPFFIGVILGDIAGAALFALLAIVLHMLGVPYEVVRFLPTSQF